MGWFSSSVTRFMRHEGGGSPAAGFRTREPLRDRSTDLQRLDRLRSAMQQISDDIIAEARGLEGRYARECGDAGFLMDAIDNDHLPEARTDRLDGLSTSILNCERRLAHLSSQLELMRRLRDSLESDLAAAWMDGTAAG